MTSVTDLMGSVEGGQPSSPAQRRVKSDVCDGKRPAARLSHNSAEGF